MAAVTAIVDKQYSPTEYDRGYNEVSLLFATCHNRQITDNWGVRRHHRRGIKKSHTSCQSQTQDPMIHSNPYSTCH